MTHTFGPPSGRSCPAADGPLGLRPLADPRATSAVGGRLVVLACPPALCPHVEFGAAAVLGVPVSLDWSSQPALGGTLCAALEWRGRSGTAGRLASRLATVSAVRFDISEPATPGCDAERYSHAPGLGLHRTVVGANGDVLVPEGPLQALLAEAAGAVGASRSAAVLEHGLRRLLGSEWDAELEPLRRGGDGARVTWMRLTG